MKDKYGSDADTDDSISDDSDSESAESEDEDGEELTPALDVAILRTLARIKARDPDIYDTGRSVFEGMSLPPSPPLFFFSFFFFFFSLSRLSGSHTPYIDRGTQPIPYATRALSDKESQVKQACDAP